MAPKRLLDNPRPLGAIKENRNGSKDDNPHWVCPVCGHSFDLPPLAWPIPFTDPSGRDGARPANRDAPGQSQCCRRDHWPQV